MAVVVLWGLLTAASVSYTLIKRLDWNAQLQQRIMSGYYDSVIDNADKPTNPVVLWIILGVSYLGLLIWSATGSASAER